MNPKVTGIKTESLVNFNPDHVLENCKGKLKHLAIFAYDHEDEYFFASTMPDARDIIWLIEILKKQLLNET